MKMHAPESKRIMSLLIMLLTTSFIFAQVTVTGSVRDERGDGVIGATVLLVGSQHGVITDVDGNFKLDVPSVKTAVLQISYIGYETQQIALKGRTKIHYLFCWYSAAYPHIKDGKQLHLRHLIQ